MNTFLNKISQLDAVQDVILLSSYEEPLFIVCKNNLLKNGCSIFSHWNEILSTLSHPATTEFIFDQGSYFLCRTNIGYIIVGLTDETTLRIIKKACATLLTKLSDPTRCKHILLNLLSTSSDDLKSNIIRELFPYADKEVAGVLTSLLHQQYKLTPENKEKLLLLIFQVLGHCSSGIARNALEDFLTSWKPELYAQKTEIFNAITVSIEQLKRSTTTTTQKKIPANQETFSSQSQKKISPSPRLLPQAERINTMLDKGERDAALSLIIQLINKCTQERQFTTATRLRDWLIKINPLALTEIIQTAELIEKAKLDAINKAHLQTWKELSAILGVEEFSSLYHAMTLKTFPRGKTIVQHGTNARTLIFINSGKVQTLVTNRNQLNPLDTKRAGDIIGADTFFEASVWTISAASLGCELLILSRRKFEALKEHHSSLESKLFDYCSRFQKTSEQLTKTKKNRRQFKRRNIFGRLTFAILNKKTNKFSNEAKGNLIDISKGGLAFFIHSSQKKNAVALFGCRLRVNISTGTTTPPLVRTGTIQAVRDMDLIGCDYSLHLEFNKQLSNSELQQVIQSRKQS